MKPNKPTEHFKLSNASTVKINSAIILSFLSICPYKKAYHLSFTVA
ncbi:MAG: hypothetical protein PG977_000186 [Bartonella clarridgeiae]|nr:MAG: hypothetical protein PG977_000186 [Bartonella clarridgeiae]